LEKARTGAPPSAKFVLVGNKSDLVESREVSRSQMSDCGEKIRAVATLEVSASTGDGIGGLRETLAMEASLTESGSRQREEWTLRKKQEGANAEDGKDF
jgi:tRNA U34 5-carboxymethylaminomethyl modifying GTPase MnmE/TrmE